MKNKSIQIGLLLLISVCSVVEGIRIVVVDKQVYGSAPAGWYLVLLGALLAALTALSFAGETMRSDKSKEQDDAVQSPEVPEKSDEKKMVLSLMSVLVGYALLTHITGYFVSTIVFFAAYFRFFGKFPWKSVAWMAVVFGCAMGFMFMEAGMTLPHGIIPLLP